MKKQFRVTGWKMDRNSSGERLYFKRIGLGTTMVLARKNGDWRVARWKDKGDFAAFVGTRVFKKPETAFKYAEKVKRK